MKMIIRTYSELITLPTYEERFEYLKLNQKIGSATFGVDRYLNQLFYSSNEWRALRKEIILRDKGFDMALKDYDILDRIVVHHMNPILVSDVVGRTEYLTNPEYLVTVSDLTHKAIHYGDLELALRRQSPFVERKPNDTCPWKL